ncbi:MAG: DegT/DnrJ/EryC1/StrS family aminotransferase [Oceanicaulis sp.]
MVSEFLASGVRRPQPFGSPVLYTRPLLPDLESLQGHLEDVWRAQYLTNGGQKAQELEKRLRALLGAQHLSLHANGTLALALALRAMNLSGEVITTPFTFAATPNSIVLAGLTPVFADIDPDSFNLDPAAVEAAITPETSAILAVHVFGRVCDVEGLQRVADKHGLKLLYDAAHAFGAEIDGRPISSFGDAVMYSLHATKLFHTAEGGALATWDADLHARIERSRNFGFGPDGLVEAAGMNSKMSELNALLGLEVLPLVEEERRKRTNVAAIYRSRLSQAPGVFIPEPQDGVVDSRQYFPIFIREAEFGLSRDALVDAMAEFNVIARRYFYPLCSEFPAYAANAAGSHLPVARHVVQEVMCLPYFGGLSDDDAQRICDIILFIHQGGR